LPNFSNNSFFFSEVNCILIIQLMVLFIFKELQKYLFFFIKQ